MHVLDTPSGYAAEISQWRQMMDERLRAEDGWLALIGLHWLHEGPNTIGSNADCDIPLPNAPGLIGVIDFQDGQATITAADDITLTIDGEQARTASLRDDTAKGGPTRVSIGSITFFVIKRGDHYGIRARDTNNPDRQNFTGRQWFPVDASFRVTGRLLPHTPARALQVINSVGLIEAISNPGRVEFDLHGQTLSLEAFAANERELWFVFKDRTSGQSTYGAGRFLYAPLAEDGAVSLDFNKAYHPPCAFTPYATCPRPPRENVLPVEIPVGERH